MATDKPRMAPRGSLFPGSLKEMFSRVSLKLGVRDEENMYNVKDDDGRKASWSASDPVVSAWQAHMDLDVRQLPATYVPDIVIALAHEGMAETFPHTRDALCVAFFTDVSGFTYVTERYSLRGNRGLEDLTKTISNYIGSLVAIILKNGGDVIKFAGDAFLSLWSTNDESELPMLVHTAVDCAVKIQSEWSEWPTAVDFTLHVKIGIACGSFTLSIFGVPKVFAHYIVTGEAIDDVQKAENLCRAGEMVLSPTAWRYLLHYGDIPDIRRVKGLNDFVKMFPVPSESASAFPEKIEVQRPALEGIRDTMLTTLKMYLMPQVKAEEGDTFPEMRPVTIVFVRLPEVDAQDTHIINKIFHHVFSAIQRLGGVLNKALFFDKGSTFLAVFGLPGFKRSNDCSSALRAAGNIIGLMKNISVKCSIGVTTGTCFCGSVGHPQRQEYTVFGSKVNMAARLMCVYSEVAVSCDADTYYQSRMDLHDANFLLLPIKPLKGIDNPGDVYEYNWQAVSTMTEDLPIPTMPLIGMVAEKRFLWVRMKLKQNARDYAGIILDPQELVTVITGLRGSGKKRLLTWCIEQAHELNYKAAGCAVKMTMKGANFATLRHLLMDVLEIKHLPGLHEKQERITELLGDESEKLHLHLLNEVLNVEFPIRKIQGQKESQRQRNALIAKLLSRCGPDIVFCICDAHRMDSSTCDVLEHCVRTGILMCFLEMTILDHKTFQEEHYATEWALKHASNVVQIGCLHKVYAAAFACYNLKVVAVHRDIVNLLKEHGHENPSWMQQLLDYLVDHKAVGVYPLEAVAAKMGDLVFWETSSLDDQTSLHPLIQFKKRMKWIYRLKAEGKFDPSLQMKACVVVADQGFLHFQVPRSVLDLVLQSVDSLQGEHRSMLIKAAILGMSFEKDTLERIFPSKTDEELVAWIQEMKQLNILDCGIAYEKSMNYLTAEGQAVDIDQQIECICSKLEMGPPGNCLSPRFRMPAIPDTVKHFLTADTRIEWNRDIALHLEKSIEWKELLCVSCRRFMYEWELLETNKPSASADVPEVKSHHNGNFDAVKTVDVRACRCSHMKVTTYRILAEQWETLSCYGKGMQYYLMAAENAVNIQRYEEARMYAGKASLLLEGTKSRRMRSSSDDTKPNLRLFGAKCERIHSIVNLRLGTLDQASSHINRARSILGGLAESLADHHLKKLVEKANYSKANWDEVIEVSRCLEVAAQVHLKLEAHAKAGAIATCNMTLLEKVSPEFLEMVRAYTAVIQGSFNNLKHHAKARKNMETKAIACCKDRLNHTMQFSTEEMQAISQLFFVIFMQRLRVGANEQATDIGMEAYGIARSLRDTNMLLRILPPLAMTFLFLKSAERCIQILGVLRPTAAEISNSVGMALYYSMMSDAIVLEKHDVNGDLVQDCRNFAMRKRGLQTNKADVNLYLVASMANWSVFHGLNMEVQKHWHELARREFDKCTRCTLWSMAGKLSFLDCRIQLLKNANIPDADEIKNEKEDIQSNLEYILSVEIRQFPIFVSRINEMIVAAEVAALGQLEMMLREEH